MGIDVRVGSTTLSKYVNSYSIDEESTPVDVSDTSGATSKFTLGFVREQATLVKRLRRKTISIEDQGQGSTEGIARVPSMDSNRGLTLSADARTVLLNANRTAQPYVGTLGGYLTYLLNLVGITSGYVIDTAITNRPVVYQGWQDSVYFQMKQALIVQRAEVSLVSDNIVFRPVRGRVTVDKRDSQVSWSLDDTGLARSVQAWLYPNVSRTNSLAYPVGGWNEDVQVYQVDAGETVVVEIPIDASLSSVQQPVAVDYVDRNYVDSSVYSVMTNDGYPMVAQQWTDSGGSISVEIGEDTHSLIVTIQGANIEQYAPFTIAATAGPSDRYSSLRLVATGVFYEDKRLYTFPTNVDHDLVTQEVGVVIDNPHITTLAQLYDSVIWAMKRYGGGSQTLNVTTKGINRRGDTGSYVYPTFADFTAQAAANGWTKFSDFTAYWNGQTFADFEAYERAEVSGQFENQAFGNVAGARTKRDFMWWRIRQAKYGPGGVSYTAEDDTLFSDFSVEWAGKTFADFNAQWAGKTFADFSVAPLEKAEA